MSNARCHPTVRDSKQRGRQRSLALCPLTTRSSVLSRRRGEAKPMRNRQWLCTSSAQLRIVHTLYQREGRNLTINAGDRGSYKTVNYSLTTGHAQVRRSRCKPYRERKVSLSLLERCAGCSSATLTAARGSGASAQGRLQAANSS